MLLAIDPGTAESAFVLYDEATARPIEKAKIGNYDLLERLHDYSFAKVPRRIAIEMVASYGQPVGKEVFETVLWIGRFWEAATVNIRLVDQVEFIYRNDVKKHLCHKIVGINDGVIRQALIDRFGPGKDAAIGKIKTPGPLYGFAGDEWAALAVAVTYADRLMQAAS